MQISFYVLSDQYLLDDTVSDSEAVLNFVCKLTQTVLQKSEHSLVIVDDNTDRLAQLDKQLWQFEPTSFVPHTLIENNNSISTDSLNASPKVQIYAPVTLVHALPDNFDGVVLNLATNPLPISSHLTQVATSEQNNSHQPLPEQVLEIITPDEVSKQQGRDKYKFYQSLGIGLTYFPIT